MPNVANLINKSNCKKKINKQHTESLKCNCINKGKCQYECKEYKVEVYNDEPNNNNGGKKVYLGSIQGAFKKKIL